jgi:hypothetical protein
MIRRSMVAMLLALSLAACGGDEPPTKYPVLRWVDDASEVAGFRWVDTGQRVTYERCSAIGGDVQDTGAFEGPLGADVEEACYLEEER